MRRLLIPMMLVSIAIAACGGNGAATQANGGDGGDQATENAAPTAANVAPTTENVAPTAATGGGGGGDNPAGWDRYGKVHVEMSGSVSKSVDLGFVPAGSLFGGAQGASLNFAIDGGNEVVSILVNADSSVLISYGGEDFAMPGAQCTTSSWNIAATSGSGSFDCTAALTIMASGATLQGGRLTGNFEAHA